MIAIIKYNAGNIKSVQNAVQRLGYETVVTDDKQVLLSAKKVIFPGVGEASTAMQYLKESALDELIINLKQPVLGICLGQQLMCKFSEEGNTDCLGIFDAKVRKFPDNMIVPHMGWNSFEFVKGKLFEGIATADDVYFVHSYYVEKNDFSLANCKYSVEFSAAMQKNNFYATQFHPEKSAGIGEKILTNFLNIKE